jgi:sarcosine oxidase subunit beta
VSAAVGGADVVIVGGGIVGSSIAFHLAEAGVTRVTVLERGRLAEGSTSRATGGVRQQFSSPVHVELARESARFYESFEARVGAPLDFRQVGYLFVAETPAVRDALVRGAEVQRGLGVPVEVLDAAGVSRLQPPIRVGDATAGTFCPEDGLASPPDACLGFVAAARRAGVAVEEGRAVTGVETAGGAVRGVRTTGGPLACDLVVDAAGVWAPDVARPLGVELPIEPHHRQVCLLEECPGVAFDSPFTVDMETGAYFHGERGGLVVGGTDNGDRRGFDDANDMDVVAGALEKLSSRLPAVRDLGVRRPWAGLREMTPDGSPLVGPAGGHEGFVVVAGFSGHGFMLAPAIGRRVAAALGSGDWDRELAGLGPDRFGAGGPGHAERHVF